MYKDKRNTMKKGTPGAEPRPDPCRAAASAVGSTTGLRRQGGLGTQKNAVAWGPTPTPRPEPVAPQTPRARVPAARHWPGIDRPADGWRHPHRPPQQTPPPGTDTQNSGDRTLHSKHGDPPRAHVHPPRHPQGATNTTAHHHPPRGAPASTPRPRGALTSARRGGAPHPTPGAPAQPPPPPPARARLSAAAPPHSPRGTRGC